MKGIAGPAALAVAAAMFVCGCSVVRESPSSAVLTGAQWRVVEIDGAAVTTEPGPSIDFGDEGRAFGSGSCNRFSVSYTLPGDGRLSLGHAVSTKMACEPGRMAQEQRFFKALETVDRYAIGADGELVLYAGDSPRLRARR